MRLGWRRPEIDHRSVEEWPRRSIRHRIWILDDNLRPSPRHVADHGRDCRIDRFDVTRELGRPRLELDGIMEGEALRLDRAPREPRPHDELPAGGADRGGERDRDHAKRPKTETIRKDGE